MGGAVIFVITIASLVTSLIFKFILAPTGFEYMQKLSDDDMEKVAAEHVASVMRTNLAEYLEKGIIK